METLQLIFSIFGFFWELIEWFLPAYVVVGILIFLFVRRARKKRQAEIDYLAKKIAEEMKKEE